MNKIQAIKNISYFNHLNDKEILSLSKNTQLLSYNNKEILYYEYDIQDKVYYLLNGALKFYKIDRFDNEIFLYELDFSSIVLDTINFYNLSNKPCFANTEFTKNSEILAFESEYFFNLLQNDINVFKKFYKDSQVKIDRLEKIINRDVVFDATAKVACMIVNDFDKFNEFKKHEIAYRLHIQPETLSRILAKMIRNNIISIIKNKLTILDKNALIKIYSQEETK